MQDTVFYSTECGVSFMSETDKWLAEQTPWLKYAVDTQLLDLKCDALPVVHDKSISLLINKLKDSQIGIPALKSGKVSYRSTGNAFWDLHFLADIGLNIVDLGLGNEVEEFFKLQLSDGSFVLQEGTKPSYYCISSIILSSLAKAGYKEDPRVKKYLQNIIDSQRLDGGWHCAVSRAKGQRLQDSESCPMDTVNILMLLGQYEEFRMDKRFKGAIDLILNHWGRRTEKWRPYGFGIGTEFVKLKYPVVKYGVLRVLDVLSMFPYAVKKDEFKEILDVAEQKSADSRYYAESVSRSYSEFDFGQTREPSRWITFLINRIQKRVKTVTTAKS
jgi:hypothetical protein